MCASRKFISPRNLPTLRAGDANLHRSFLDARDEFGLDLSQSYLIGDKLSDLECGWNAGVGKSLLVRTGYGAELERTAADELKRAIIVDDLAAAASWILGQG